MEIEDVQDDEQDVVDENNEPDEVEGLDEDGIALARQNRKRNKRKDVDPRQWEKNRNYDLRQKGKPYKGANKKKNGELTPSNKTIFLICL